MKAQNIETKIMKKEWRKLNIKKGMWESVMMLQDDAFVVGTKENIEMESKKK